VRLDVKKIIAGPLTATLFLMAALVEAQQPGKVPWIGYLAGSGSSPNQAFVQGMRDLGYIEGKNIGFVYRTTEGKRESYADFVAELVRLKVDVIVTDSTDAALLAKKATSTIPIVMTRGTDPVGAGLVTSLARPGGNVTGLTSVTGELAGKLLELLKETIPKLTHAAILRPKGRADDLFVKEAEVPGRALGVQLIPVVVQGPDDIERAFRAMGKERVNGLIMRLPASGYSTHYKRVAELYNNEKSSTSYLYKHYLGGRRRPHVIRTGLQHWLSPRRHLCGQNSQRREARRSPH
jgi:putative ABC transport system substrate-binding protein